MQKILMNNDAGYVLGFMFCSGYRRVCLIEKKKPDWQRDRLNGVGGLIEKGETELQAMVREFQEETGYLTKPEQWTNFARMNLTGVFVECFATVGLLDLLRTTTKEPVIVADVNAVIAARDDIAGQRRPLHNIPWLLLLALDSLNPFTGHPRKTTIQCR